MNARKWAASIFIIAALIAATAGVVWLSGFLFFAFSRENPMGKTDFTTWWTYWTYYQADPGIKKKLLMALGVSAAVVYGVLGAMALGALKDRRKLYGEARFANGSEIARANLLGDDGIIVGKWKNKFLMFGGMQFVMLAAPTRSGKGVGIVIPNLLNWRDSVVVLDVKQENFLITSGYRARHGQDVYLFNPFSADGVTHRYNPLGYISIDRRKRVEEIIAIGYSLYPGDGKDAFFDDAARNLFLGLTLYLCETPSLPRTFGELLRQSSGKGKPVKEYINGLVTDRNYEEVEEEDADGETVKVLRPIEHWKGEGLPPLSMECVDALNRFTTTSDNTLSSIMATFNVPLTLWASPTFDAATSENDFDLREVRKRRMSIYIGIPANKLAEAKLIINMLFSQLINLNMDFVLHSKPELKYQCLLLMDEFTAPGRIGIIDTANSFMAGYGMRPLTIIQSPGQLEKDPPRGYGREGARTMVTNHACQILYTPREQRDATEYSEMLGYYTYKATGRSRQLGKGGGSESESDQKRPLMMPQELKEMGQREQIINLENTKPIRCTKIAYFSDPVFMDRLREVSPTLRAIRGLPSKNQLESVWGSGELAAYIPLLDFSEHEAKVEARVREAQPADVAGAIDLRKIALDGSRIEALAAESDLTKEEAESFVDDFFDALDAQTLDFGVIESADEIGQAGSASDEELERLAAEAAAEEPDDEGELPGGTVAPDEGAYVDESAHELRDDPGTMPQDEEEAWYPDAGSTDELDPDAYPYASDDDDVAHPDDAEADDGQMVDQSSGNSRNASPRIDLSVLDRP